MLFTISASASSMVLICVLASTSFYSGTQQALCSAYQVLFANSYILIFDIYTTSYATVLSSVFICFIISFCKPSSSIARDARIPFHCMPQGIFIFIKIDWHFIKFTYYPELFCIFRKHLLYTITSAALPVFTSFSVQNSPLVVLPAQRCKPTSDKILSGFKLCHLPFPKTHTLPCGIACLKDLWRLLFTLPFQTFS